MEKLPEEQKESSGQEEEPEEIKFDPNHVF